MTCVPADTANSDIPPTGARTPMSGFASSPVAAALNFALQTGSLTPPAMRVIRLLHLECTNDPAFTPRSTVHMRSRAFGSQLAPLPLARLQMRAFRIGHATGAVHSR